MGVQSTNLPTRAVPLRGWPFLSTLGALPILAPIFIFNGILSVEGLPALWSLLMGPAPRWVESIFLISGWSTVFFSFLIEVRVIYRTIKGREVSGGLLAASLFFGIYDLATTGLGLFIRLAPSSLFGWVAWPILTIFITFLVEIVLSTLWKESNL